MISRSDEEAWARVWAEMNDAELEDALRRYLWLAANTPNNHASRVQQLITEAQRRGKPEMVERIQAWVKRTPAKVLS
jgi:hypothetical protein